MHVMHTQFMMPNCNMTAKEELMDLHQMMTVKQFAYDFNQKILDVDSDLAEDFPVFLFICGLKTQCQGTGADASTNITHRGNYQG